MGSRAAEEQVSTGGDCDDAITAVDSEECSRSCPGLNPQINVFVDAELRRRRGWCMWSLRRRSRRELSSPGEIRGRVDIDDGSLRGIESAKLIRADVADLHEREQVQDREPAPIQKRLDRRDAGLAIHGVQRL